MTDGRLTHAPTILVFSLLLSDVKHRRSDKNLHFPATKAKSGKECGLREKMESVSLLYIKLVKDSQPPTTSKLY